MVSEEKFRRIYVYAVSNINNIISQELIGKSVFDQQSNDHLMISMDADKNKGKSSFLELIKTLFYAGFIAVIFRSLFFEAFNIPSG